MKRIFVTLLFCMIFGVATASAQKNYCFQNEGLKVQQKVDLTITGNKVEGTFETGGYEETASAETFDFTGIKTGNQLTIKFAGKPPYELPPGTKRIVWIFGNNALKIPIYGKNYDTKKYSVYAERFDKCKED